MAVKVIFFGHLGEKTGTSKTEVEDVSSLNELRSKLAHEFSILGEFDFLIAVNQEVVKGDCELKDGDEIAYMPPFAGG